jgi:hypothetical protein
MGTATKEKIGTVSAYENLKQCKKCAILKIWSASQKTVTQEEKNYEK